MVEATWALARESRPPRLRTLLWRELRRSRLPIAVWLPSASLSLMAFAWNGLMDTDLYVPAVGATALAVLAYRRLGSFRRPPTDEELALWHGFGRDGAWLVDLLVLQGAAPTGGDRGMLWIEGGRLMFLGAATSFGLVPAGVAGRCRPQAAVPGLPHGLALPLARRTRAGGLSLSLVPVMDPAERPEIVAAIDAWASGSLDDEGQDPPTALGPGALPTTGLVALVALDLLHGAGAAILVLRADSRAELLVRLALAAAVGWALGLGRLGLRLRAVRDRRRAS